MNGQPANIHNIAEVEAFEKTPLIARMRAHNVFHLVAMGAAHDADRAVIHYLRHADPDETPETLSYGGYLTRIRQAANLFHRLAGEGGVTGVLLPMVPENYVTLAAGPTAGILAPVNWALSAEAIAAVMRAAKVNVLVALGPSPEFTIWERRKRWPNWCPVSNI